MKSQDIYILIKLVCLEQSNTPASAQSDEQDSRYSVRGLSAASGVSKSEVSASLRRSIEVGMAMQERKSGYLKANKQALLEFVVHGLKYVFPAKPAEIVRGLPTGFSAPTLEGKLLSLSDYTLVWPYSHGNAKGQSVQPLFKSVPEAVLQDERLYAYLALVDAIRTGSPREANLAAEMFEKRLMNNG